MNFLQSNRIFHLGYLQKCSSSHGSVSDLVCLDVGYEKQVAMFHVQASSMQRFLAQAFQHEDTVWTAAMPGHRRVLITGSEDHIIRVRGIRFIIIHWKVKDHKRATESVLALGA